MSASDAEAWARLRLVQGRSNAELWELVHALGHSMLTVGAGPGCSWTVQESGVAPVHFSLHWDGAALRIADTYGVGNLRVDGAPVFAEWRLISGRARIDFGQAAIVVETSAANGSDLGHPLDREPLPPLSDSRPAEARRASSRPVLHGEVAAHGNVGETAARAAPKVSSPKATLLGVAPLTPHGAPIIANVPNRATVPIETPAAAPEERDSYRVKRPSDNVRAPKPTLLGMATQPRPASAPGSAEPTAQAGSPTVTRPMNQTLHGGTDVNSGQHAPSSSQHVGGASLTRGDQRTMHGFPAGGATGTQPGVTVSTGGSASGGSAGGSASSVPPGRRETQRGVISAPPGGPPAAVMQMRVKPISDQAPSSTSSASSSAHGPAGDDASATEVMDPGFSPYASGREVPQAVLLGGSPDAAYPGAHDHLSDPDAEMHEAEHFESRRPRRPFPWHYVGLAALTALAYAAWLYLLDHL